MITIEVTKKTEYIAKRICIEAAIKMFEKRQNLYFLKLVAKWDEGNEEIVARREIISQFCGVDFVKAKEYDVEQLKPKAKEEYIELWEGMKKHEPKTDIIQKAKNIVAKIKSKL